MRGTVSPRLSLPLVMPLPLLMLGATSIASLLGYFYGVIEMRRSVQWLLLPVAGGLLLLILWARYTQRTALCTRILAGLWAGALATLAYDLVRVPIVWAGIPVFKAISYFGTVITAQTVPTVLSEVIGWSYHLSNGIGFGLMYTAVILTPRWWSAALWGLLLEGAMLLTPYAEVFGYKISPTFLTITIGAHVIYGLTLWGGLQYWFARQIDQPKYYGWRLYCMLTGLLVPVSIGAIATDFHWRYGSALPPSPPAYLGPHLYTTWHVLEPDRVAALWVLQRFVDHQARVHFVPPFTQNSYGTPFDIPEATLRRSGTQSVTEILLAQEHLDSNPRLALLARMTHLYEITPWMRPTDPAAYQFGQELLAAIGHCSPPEVTPCFLRALGYLDRWYATPG